MTRAAETTLEQPSPPVPLGAEEISHLIETARAETYRAKEDAPQKPTGTFKAKSLMDLAREARMKEPVAEVELPQASVVEEAPAAMGEPSEPEPLADEVSEAEVVPEPSLIEEAPAPRAAEPPPAVTAPDPELLERVRAEAFEAGQAEARRADAERQTHALEMLEAAARSLITPPETALAQLRASIAASVKQLASARAGLAIDDLPEPFLVRIEELADRIHACSSAPVLRLHPDDLDAISDYVSQSEILSEMRIVAGSDLSRGDVELTLGGLALSDRMEPLEGRRRRMVFAHGGIKAAADGQTKTDGAE